MGRTVRAAETITACLPDGICWLDENWQDRAPTVALKARRFVAVAPLLSIFAASEHSEASEGEPDRHLISMARLLFFAAWCLATAVAIPIGLVNTPIPSLHFPHSLPNEQHGSISGRKVTPASLLIPC
jgi:hypothetical protein